jgi:uracil-DNA glycosylase
MTTTDRTVLLRQIRDEVAALAASPLYKYRVANGYHPVIGEGDHAARIMFVGEAPGRNEAQTGRPFCGAAGRLLDRLLADIDLPRQAVYITNILKDRPPENRDPNPEEIALYGPFLDRQIEVIQPAAIVTLGRFSMSYIMTKFGLGDALRSISVLHGRMFKAAASYGPVIIIPFYHPAAAIYHRALEDVLRQDFQVMKKLLGDSFRVDERNLTTESTTPKVEIPPLPNKSEIKPLTLWP